jgi:hypothetical protein
MITLPLGIAGTSVDEQRLVLLAEVVEGENTGFGALWPSPHRLVSRTVRHSDSRFTRSAVARRPRQILSSSWWSSTVPARHGTHLPQLSSRQNSMKYFATSGMRTCRP